MLGTKQYQIIYADPPWQYNDRNTRGSAEGQYTTMSLSELKALPVPEIADENSYMFLWATSPLLPEALELLNSWGFKYKTMGFVWLKMNLNSFGCFIGTGHYTRPSVEVCLLGTKGKLEIQNKGVRQVIMSPRMGHSRKPSEIRERIVALLGDLPRIELFARRRVDGWDAWGNEV